MHVISDAKLLADNNRIKENSDFLIPISMKLNVVRDLN